MSDTMIDLRATATSSSAKDVSKRLPAETYQQANLRFTGSRLINVQLVQERERVVEGLEQILVVLDHLAAHVDAKPLLVDVQLVAIEPVYQRYVTLCDESRQVHRTLEPSEIDWKYGEPRRCRRRALGHIPHAHAHGVEA